MRDGAAVVHTTTGDSPSGKSFRTLAAPISTAVGNRVYGGFDLGVTDTSYDTFAGLSFFSGNQEALFRGGDPRYGINAGVGAAWSPSAGPSASAAYVLVEIMFNAANNFTVNMYLDPVGPLGAAELTYTGGFVGGASWHRVRLSTIW